jgi:hypothetical protein
LIGTNILEKPAVSLVFLVEESTKKGKMVHGIGKNTGTKIEGVS